MGNGWWPNEPETTVGIDQVVGDPKFLHRGLGTLMVREFSNWLLSQHENETVITDPKPENMKAIQCYQRAGFNDVGLIDTPDGRVVLMEKRAG